MAARRLQAVIRTLEHEREGYPDEHIELQKVICKKTRKEPNKVSLSQQESVKSYETQAAKTGVKEYKRSLNNTNENHSKWNRFKNLFKRQHKSVAQQNNEESEGCHTVTSNGVKQKPVTKRKIFRNIQKLFQRNKISPIMACTSSPTTQPSQKSQMKNINTFYRPVKVTSSVCSNEFNYEGCETETNYESMIHSIILRMIPNHHTFNMRLPAVLVFWLFPLSKQNVLYLSLYNHQWR